MNLHLNVLALIITFLILPGCDKKNTIDDNKMVLIYTDILIAQDTSSVENINVDSLRTMVLNRHQISEDEYRKTIEYYNEDRERWENFFDRVTKHIEELAEGKKEIIKEN